MSFIDIVIVAVVLLSALLSFRRGLFREAMSLATWAGAVIVTVAYTSRFATLLPREAIESPTARATFAALGLFFGTLAAGTALHWLIRRIVAAGRPGWIDRFAGAAFGLARGAIVVALATLAANLVPSFKAEPWWRSSRLLPPFQGVARTLHAQLPVDVAEHFDFPPVGASTGRTGSTADADLATGG